VRAKRPLNSLGPRPRGPPCPLRWVGIVRETCRRATKKPGSETPNVCPTKNIIRKGPAPGWRGGGPPCPLRWTWIGRESFPWAAKPDLLLYFLLFHSLGLRPRGPLCPLRWIWIGRESSRWAAKRPASETPCVPHREHHPAKPCPEGTFLDSPGFVRSTTLGCVAIIHFSPEGAGLTGGAGMNRGLKSTSIVRVQRPTIGPVPATAASSEPLQGSGV